MNNPPINPYLLIGIGVISISTAAVLVKLAGSAPASIIANYRLLIAVLIMAPYVLWKKTGEFRLISKKDWLLTVLAGIFLALHFIFWFESLDHTSVASSVVLVSLQPIFAFLGTYFFFKERFSSGLIISMIIALIGSILIGWGDFRISEEAFLGDLLALLGAVMVTVYFLSGQSVRTRLSVVTYTFIVYGISALTLIIYNLVLGYSFVGYTGNQWLIFLALAIVPTFFGHSLFNWALRWVSTSTISMGIIFEPVGASLLAYLILGEEITPAQWLGGTIVIFGLMLFILSTRRKGQLTFSEEKLKAKNQK